MNVDRGWCFYRDCYRLGYRWWLLRMEVANFGGHRWGDTADWNAVRDLLSQLVASLRAITGHLADPQGVPLVEALARIKAEWSDDEFYKSFCQAADASAAHERKMRRAEYKQTPDQDVARMLLSTAAPPDFEKTAEWKELQALAQGATGVNPPQRLQERWDDLRYETQDWLACARVRQQAEELDPCLQTFPQSLSEFLHDPAVAAGPAVDFYDLGALVGELLHHNWIPIELNPARGFEVLENLCAHCRIHVEFPPTAWTMDRYAAADAELVFSAWIGQQLRDLNKLIEEQLKDRIAEEVAPAASPLHVPARAIDGSPPEEILQTLNRVQPKSEAELRELGFKEFLARSPFARRAATAALQFLKQPGPILIVAPTGCGKEMFVRDLAAIHGGRTEHTSPPTITGGELDSEPGWSDLVGVRPGAATGTAPRAGLLETAERGVLFLDEFHAVPTRRQHDLLRILDDQNPDFAPVGSGKRQRVEAKIIAATSENLWGLARAKQFHRPLLARFGVRVIWLPPLHERPEDIGALLEQQLSKLEIQHSPPDISAVAAFVAREGWDGRVLKSQLDSRRREDSKPTIASMFPELSSELETDQAQRERIEQLLVKHSGNISTAAQDYYFHDTRKKETRRKNFERLCSKLGIDPQPFRSSGMDKR